MTAKESGCDLGSVAASGRTDTVRAELSAVDPSETLATQTRLSLHRSFE
jgi:hypothetical protein